MLLKDYLLNVETLVKNYGAAYGRIAPTHILLFGIKGYVKLGSIDINTYELPIIDFRDNQYYSKKLSDDKKIKLENMNIISINAFTYGILEIYLDNKNITYKKE